MTTRAMKPENRDKCLCGRPKYKWFEKCYTCKFGDDGARDDCPICQNKKKPAFDLCYRCFLKGGD